MRFANLSDPIELLPQKTRQIIRRHQQGRYVELRPLLAELGIDMERVALPEAISGESFYREEISEGRFVIRVNNSMSVERQRFTAAHEIGHCLLHASEVRNRSADDQFLGVLNRSVDATYCALQGEYILDPLSDEAELARELEANKFAGYLLIPAPILNKLWRGGFREDEDVAKLLGVSVQALRAQKRELKGNY